MEDNSQLLKIEKSSTIIRNVIVIFGAVVSGGLFLSDRLKDDIEVHALTSYLDGKNTMVTVPDSLGVDAGAVGRLGTFSQIDIISQAKSPVSLEVRIPGGTSMPSRFDPGWKVFSTVSADASCFLRENEISITGGGYVPAGEVGMVEVKNFPPGCMLEIVVATTQVDETMRFMTGNVQVFSNGQRVDVSTAYVGYGFMAEYLKLLNSRGAFSVVVYLLMPLLLVMYLYVSLLEKFLRKKGGAKQESEPDGA